MSPQAPPTRSRSLAFSGFGQADVFSRFRGDPASSGPSERSNGCNPLKGREMTEDLAGPVATPKAPNMAGTRTGRAPSMAGTRTGRAATCDTASVGWAPFMAGSREGGDLCYPRRGLGWFTCLNASWAGSRAPQLPKIPANLRARGRGRGMVVEVVVAEGGGWPCTTISTSAPAQPLRTRTHTRRGSPSPTHATARTQSRELEAVPNATSHPAKPSKVTN